MFLVFIRSNSKVNRQKMSSAKDKSIDATSEQIIRRLFGISKKHKYVLKNEFIREISIRKKLIAFME